MSDAYDQMLADLEEHLRYRLECGEQTVEMDPAILHALRATPVPQAARPAPPDASPARTRQAPERPPEAPAQETRATSPDAARDPAAALARVAETIAGCEVCGLCGSRSRTVPGQGHPQPDILFVGEGPGAEEDRQGLAFVGPAGQLLSSLIERLGLTREEVFIANILKCRPPGNRTPQPNEMEACMPYLREQIRILKPRVIVALGGTAAKALLETDRGITRLRGNWFAFEGIDLMPTYHPSYLLRDENKAKRWETWNDMLAVLDRVGLPRPEGQGGGQSGK